MGWLKRLFGKDDKKSEPQATWTAVHTCYQNESNRSQFHCNRRTHSPGTGWIEWRIRPKRIGKACGASIR